MEFLSTPDPPEAYPRTTHRERLRAVLGRIAHGLLSSEESQDRMSLKHSSVLDAEALLDDSLESQATAAMDWLTAFVREVEAGTLPAVLADEPCVQFVPFQDIRRIVGEWRDDNRAWLDAAAESTKVCRSLGCDQISRESLMDYCADVPAAEASLRVYIESALDDYHHF
mgnify:CR=1 FL=1